MPTKPGQKIRPAFLYSSIATLLFVVAIQQLQIYLLKDSIASRDTDIYNCELDAAGAPAPRQYKKAWATLY